MSDPIEELKRQLDLFKTDVRIPHNPERERMQQRRFHLWILYKKTRDRVGRCKWKERYDNHTAEMLALGYL